MVKPQPTPHWLSCHAMENRGRGRESGTQPTCHAPSWQAKAVWLHVHTRILREQGRPRIVHGSMDANTSSNSSSNSMGFKQDLNVGNGRAAVC
eukprot:365349-Chlamydomonas_euryale.AAC.8